MPLTIEPPKKTQGPGSAPGTRRRRIRARRPQLSTTSKDLLDPKAGPKTPSIQTDSFIGQELVELQLHSRQSETMKKQSSNKNPPKDAVTSVTNSDNRNEKRDHTVCLDTRFIDTKAGRDAELEIVHGYKSFLRDLEARGDYCNIIVTTKSEKREKSAVDFARVRSSQKPKVNALIQGVALSDSSSSSTENEVCMPDELSADTSWKLFTRMIVSMVSDREQNSRAKQLPSLEFTILSSDMALFSDTSSEKHVSSFQNFVKNIMAFPQAKRISLIRLVVVKTHTLAIEESKESTVVSNTEAYQAAVAQCASAIKASMDEIEINGALASTTAQPVQYSLTVIEGSDPSYQALCRKIFRDTLLNRDFRRRVSFDLPETSDGTQCRIVFEIFFQTFPHKLGSQEAECLLNDLHRLSSSSFEIIQLMPLPCVDASLLYGVPYAVNTALEQNFDRFEETECLTTIFFRYLQERDLSVLLRSHDNQYSGQSYTVDQPQDGQFFLLMPQEFPVTMNMPPRSGLLFHYADANQLLSEPVQTKANKNLDSDLGLQYAEYIESAMSTVECKPFNPLLSEIDRIPEEKTVPSCFQKNFQKVLLDSSSSGKNGIDPVKRSKPQLSDSDEEEPSLEQLLRKSPEFEESDDHNTRKRRVAKRAPYNLSPAASLDAAASIDCIAGHSLQSRSKRINRHPTQKSRSRSEVSGINSDTETVESVFDYDW